jgi:flagellar biosynthesis protein FlhF
MKLKSYFADTIEEAISLARREMGPEAMLVNSKRSNAEARHLGACEVVCAAEVEPQFTEPDRVRGLTGSNTAPIDKLSQDVSEIKHQMERLALTLARSTAGMAGIASDPELANAFATLTAAELDADLAYDLIGKIGAPFRPDALRDELGRLLTVDAALGRAGSHPPIVALVGPPGSGKTTTLVKLAVQYGVASRKATQILTVDTLRVGASDQLRSYAAILGVGFQVLETTTALARALDEQHHLKDLILIDTPGLALNELEAFGDLADFLSTHPAVDTHLVLPASMRTSDLKRVANQYEIFKPFKLLFTRLDETETFGPILSQSVRSGKPVSFLTRGQRIPEDLEEATRDSILNMVLKPEAFSERYFGTAAA